MHLPYNFGAASSCEAFFLEVIFYGLAPRLLEPVYFVRHLGGICGRQLAHPHRSGAHAACCCVLRPAPRAARDLAGCHCSVSRARTGHWTRCLGAGRAGVAFKRLSVWRPTCSFKLSSVSGVRQFRSRPTPRLGTLVPSCLPGRDIFLHTATATALNPCSIGFFIAVTPQLAKAEAGGHGAPTPLRHNIRHSGRPEHHGLLPARRPPANAPRQARIAGISQSHLWRRSDRAALWSFQAAAG